MKTLVSTAGNLSKYIFPDDAAVTFEVRQVAFGGETREIPYTQTPHFTIADLHGGNAVLYENVTPPPDWDGNKYCFDGQSWSLNPWYDMPEASPTN